MEALLHRGYSKYLRYLLFWSDLLILNFINIGSGYYLQNSFYYFNDSAWLQFSIVYNISWLIITFLNPPGNILSKRKLDILVLSRSVLLNILIHGSLILGYEKLFQAVIINPFYSSYIILGVVVIISRMLILSFLKGYRKRGFNYRNIILVVKDNSSVLIKNYFEGHEELGYRLKKVYTYDLLKPESNTLRKFQNFLEINEIDEVFLDSANASNDQLVKLINLIEDQFIKVRVTSEASLELKRKLRPNNFGDLWFLEISPIPMDRLRNRIYKRLFDIVFSILIIIFILTWIFPIVGILIIIESGMPILFKQLRTGIKNKEFYCIKFRTMKVNSQADKIQSTKNDSRVSKLGRFLRATSIDELPQFFNVLKGEMAVVGPRPLMVKHTRDYSKIVNRYFQRHNVKPGITGLAQINGLKGEITTDQDIKNRIELDKFYIENWTPVLDIKIIVSTLPEIFNISSNEKPITV